MKTYRSYFSEETKKLGESLARKILKRSPRRSGATVFALRGDLGSGKTTFIQGFLRGLGLRRGGASPTFILMRRHALPSLPTPPKHPLGLRRLDAKASAGRRHEQFKNVYHVDAYRVKKAGELLELDFGEILADARNVVLIEWAEKVKKILPKNVTWIKFRHGRRENERMVVFIRK